MKELKAVSYLRKIKEYYSVSFSDEAIQNIDEALAELKELMQVKSCDGCSHSPTTSDNCWHCIRGVKQDHYTPNG